jgi:hypothetical protein
VDARVDTTADWSALPGGVGMENHSDDRFVAGQDHRARGAAGMRNGE